MWFAGAIALPDSIGAVSMPSRAAEHAGLPPGGGQVQAVLGHRAPDRDRETQANTVIAACIGVLSAEITLPNALDDPAADTEISSKVIALGGSRKTKALPLRGRDGQGGSTAAPSRPLCAVW